VHSDRGVEESHLTKVSRAEGSTGLGSVDPEGLLRCRCMVIEAGYTALRSLQWLRRTVSRHLDNPDQNTAVRKQARRWSMR